MCPVLSIGVRSGATMAVARVRLGELLVEAQIITRQQLEEVLLLQKTDRRRLGTLLVEAGFVTETQVTQILSQQLSVPWVSLYHIDFSRQLLNLVPREIAEKYCLIPIFVRRVRGLGETLYVAMDDPSDDTAVRDVSQWSGLPVRAMIAPPSDVRSAIRVYYGGELDGGTLARQGADTPVEVPPIETSEQPVEKAPPASSAPVSSRRLEAVGPRMASEPAPAARPSVPAPKPEPEPATAAPRISQQPDSGPRIEAREITLPARGRGKASRMISLTLLDGTQVTLPARPGNGDATGEQESTAAERLTARDLVAALRALAQGADAKEILGEEVRWEPLFAALLAVLLRKHLIADWEFVDEYKKI
jgi:type IV pilus assembly protein PilB